MRVATTFGALAVMAGMHVAHAADWYVDAAAPASGSGTSRRSAWQRFADIDWSTLGPGDTLRIVGDRCGPAYTETLVVGTSGSDGAPLTITGGPGAPVIDGGNRRQYGVMLRERDHVIVRGLIIRNHAGAGIAVRRAREGVLIEGNDIFSGDPGGGNARGIDARENVGASPLIVRANRYGTPASTQAQTDGIWSSDNDGAVFEGNRIVISNNSDHGHSDGIQSFRDINIIVRGNWFEQANAAVYNNHGAWLENTRSGGVVEFYDNFVLTPNLNGDANVSHSATADWTGTGLARIRNNTIVGGDRAVQLYRSPNSHVRDNVIWTRDRGGRAYDIKNGEPPATNIDGNLAFSDIGPFAYVSGVGNLTWAQWRARGYDARGVNAAPRLDLQGLPRPRAAGTVPAGAPGPPPLAGAAPSTCPARR